MLRGDGDNMRIPNLKEAKQHLHYLYREGRGV